MRAQIAVIFALLLPTLTAADYNGDPNCTGPGGYWLPTAGVHEVSPLMRAEGTLYVEDRGFALGWGLWIYAESNGVYEHGRRGIENLQHGGESIVVPDDSEICDDANPAGPDTLVW